MQLAAAGAGGPRRSDSNNAAHLGLAVPRHHEEPSSEPAAPSSGPFSLLMAVAGVCAAVALVVAAVLKRKQPDASSEPFVDIGMNPSTTYGAATTLA